MRLALLIGGASPSFDVRSCDSVPLPPMDEAVKVEGVLESVASFREDLSGEADESFTEERE